MGSRSLLNAHDAHPAGAPDAIQWSARILLTPQRGAVAVAYVRDHTLRIAAPISFKPARDPAPSALEALLAALGSEVATGFAERVRRAGLIVDGLEATVRCYLENPLVAAGVVGEVGSPALAALTITLYVASPEPEDALQSALDDALVAAPVYATLARACPIALTLHITL